MSGSEIIEHTWIAMPDGVRLSARLWLPAGLSEKSDGRTVPVVLEYLPYRKRDAYRSTDNLWGSVLQDAGIGFARVDVRGTGDSEGVLTDEYSERELADGEACIDWLSRQPWCNGRVGMRGISWGGINSLQIAARQPTALKAIMPMAAAVNRFTDDAHYIGGLIGKPNLDWGVLFKTVLAAPPDPAVTGKDWAVLWEQRLAQTPALITNWLRHRVFDEYWQRGSVCQDYESIRCPVYLVGGWQDAYLSFIEHLLAALNVPVKALIGPWGHTYPHLARPQSLDWAGEEVRWWRHWLLGEDTGIMAEPRLRFFSADATARQTLPDPLPGRWLAEDDWPENPSLCTFALADRTLIPGQPTAAEQSRWTFDTETPVGFAKTEWLDRLPEEQSRDDEHSLYFDTALLEEDLELLGRAVARLSMTVQSEDCAVSVRLMDVAPDGSSWLVSYGIIDLAFRQGFETRLEAAVGETVSVELQLSMAAHRFRPGHRLRLAVAGGLWPMTWPSADGDRFTLCSGGSCLEIPLLPETASSALLSAGVKSRSTAAPARLPAVKRTADGRYHYELIQSAYTVEVSGVGTTLSGAGRFDAFLGPGRASHWRQSTTRGWQRDEWHCEVVASCDLERVDAGLRVQETLRAYSNGEPVFEKLDESIL